MILMKMAFPVNAQRKWFFQRCMPASIEACAQHVQCFAALREKKNFSIRSFAYRLHIYAFLRCRDGYFFSDDVSGYIV